MGKPTMWKHILLHGEKLAMQELTEGTETSKYLEEKKSIEISLVAASEREKAQTGTFMSRGCRTFIR